MTKNILIDNKIWYVPGYCVYQDNLKTTYFIIYKHGEFKVKETQTKQIRFFLFLF